MDDLLYPASEARDYLLTEVIEWLSALPYVRRLLCFGSLARGDSDRWSDIDLIAVTDSQAQYKLVLEALEAARPIRHRNQFVAHVEPAGGHVLGIIFEGASVFHGIDLNLLTMGDVQIVGSLDRFGVSQVLHIASINPAPVWPDNFDAVNSEPEDAAEEVVKVAVHFTKKAAKRVLRGIDDWADLARWTTELKQTMAGHPIDWVVGGRQTGWLAQTYLDIADQLLRNRPNRL